MEIIIAKTAGFCFGVKRAVELAFANQNIEGTYTFGPIIHNEVVTGQLEEKGIYVIDDIENKAVKNLIIRSHGVSPNIYEESAKRNIKVIDATCPYVKKIHDLVKVYHQKGYGIIIAGNKQHPEVQGINGWADNRCLIVKDANELKASMHQLTKDHYLLVAQTTYKKEVVDEMVEWLKMMTIHFEYVNTICNATRQRQEEVVQIAKKVDVMLILGSKNSSNSQKLFEISQKYCKRSYFISDLSELDSYMVELCNKVGITAGASTPESVIAQVVKYLEQLET